ncbi:MAG: hypothetical protein A4E69_02511 [Syntrophus sp. PtaB.Bin138]|nr:MAG: hypothetical protein A4E69_02511 [Syntrophus sp. PtaB.Bin138]
MFAQVIEVRILAQGFIVAESVCKSRIQFIQSEVHIPLQRIEARQIVADGRAVRFEFLGFFQIFQGLVEFMLLHIGDAAV